MDLSTILEVICLENDVNIEDVRSKSRKAEFVETRREFCYLANEMTKESLKDIGSEINKTYPDVIFHRDKIKSWLGLPGENYREKLERIKTKL